MMAAAAAAAAATKRGRRGRKQSGRPPPPPSSPPPAAEPRRTLRPRRHRPLLLDDFANFDDYLVDDEELVEGHGDEEQERTWRNLKLVLRLPRSPVGKRREEGGTARARRFGSPPATAKESGHRREPPGPTVEASSSSAASSSSFADAEEDAEEEVKPPKKRRFDGSDDAGSSDEEERRENVVPRRKSLISGLSTSATTGTPLPNMKLLEMILDKLQKKDTYGAFAQPVDLEELPDYHEVIEHPMDYGTVRKKLARNAYHSLEQFEDDVFLICNNAMEYNAPDTVYFRQARTMQDIGRKEFQKLRSEFKCTEFDCKTEERIKSRPPERKPVQKVLPKIIQEPLGSEISSAATLASTGDACTLLSAPPATSVVPDPPVAISGIADGSSSLGESKSEKLDELSAKDSPSKFGRKSFVVDENRRASYNMLEQQPSTESDLVLDIFEGEERQLVAVGLEVEYPYARSLARFAATLGPIGWKIASQKIESALPTDVKFGPGWVGEYEPLPTPILSLEKQHQKQSCAVSSMQFKMGLNHSENFGGRTNILNGSTDSRSTDQSQINVRSSSRDSDRVRDGNGHTRAIEARQQLFSNTPETQLRAPSTKLQNQREQMAVHFEQVNSKVLQQVGFFRPPSLDSPMVNRPTKRPDTIPFDNRSMTPELQKQTGTLKGNPEASRSCSMDDGFRRNISEANNGKVSGSSSSDNMSNTANFTSKHQSGMLGKWRTRETHEQGFIENSKLMGFSGKVIDQSNNSKKATDSPRPFPPSVPPAGRESPNNAASVAARAWMSVGASSHCKPSADSVNISSRQTGPTTYGSWTIPNSSSRNIENEQILPVSQALRQPVPVVGFQTPVNNKGLVIFPQLVPTDLSRFHSQTPWQGLVPQMQNHNKICPPDLNISFQPPGSPIPQSSSILKESQQPDLALQL